MDIERELAFIGERFEGATDRHAKDPNPLPLQKPLKSLEMKRLEMATAKENASAALGYVIGTSHDRERVLATDVLLDTLAGSNEAPLKHAVMEAGLADDFTATLVDGVQQPLAFLELKGLHDGAAEKFRPFVEDFCQKLVSDGIDHEKLEASLAQAEFNLREGDWGYSDGVALSIQALSSWLYDDDRPYDYLRYEASRRATSRSSSPSSSAKAHTPPPSSSCQSRKEATPKRRRSSPTSRPRWTTLPFSR